MHASMLAPPIVWLKFLGGAFLARLILAQGFAPRFHDHLRRGKNGLQLSQDQSFHLTGTDVANFTIWVDAFSVMHARVSDKACRLFYGYGSVPESIHTHRIAKASSKNSLSFLACDCASVDRVFVSDGADFIPPIHMPLRLEAANL